MDYGDREELQIGLDTQLPHDRPQFTSPIERAAKTLTEIRALLQALGVSDQMGAEAREKLRGLLKDWPWVEQVRKDAFNAALERSIVIAAETLPTPDGPRNLLWDEIVHRLSRERGWSGL